MHENLGPHLLGVATLFTVQIDLSYWFNVKFWGLLELIFFMLTPNYDKKIQKYKISQCCCVGCLTMSRFW